MLKNGESLWMGSLFDDVTAWRIATVSNIWVRRTFPFPIRKRAPTAGCCIVMTEEGFAGHPTNGWHFSWGDQMWAALTDIQGARIRIGGYPERPEGAVPIHAPAAEPPIKQAGHYSRHRPERPSQSMPARCVS